VDRNGYTLDGDLLRPARVIVGQPAHRPVGDG
jgi:molecular chaperone GrpE (heat shock protein)